MMRTKSNFPHNRLLRVKTKRRGSYRNVQFVGLVFLTTASLFSDWEDLAGSCAGHALTVFHTTRRYCFHVTWTEIGEKKTFDPVSDSNETSSGPPSGYPSIVLFEKKNLSIHFLRVKKKKLFWGELKGAINPLQKRMKERSVENEPYAAI